MARENKEDGQMSQYFDDLETRSAEDRAADLAKALPEQIARAKGLPGYAEAFADVDPSSITSAADLVKLAGSAQIGTEQGTIGKPAAGGLQRHSGQDFAHIFPVAGADL